MEILFPISDAILSVITDQKILEQDENKNYRLKPFRSATTARYVMLGRWGWGIEPGDGKIEEVMILCACEGPTALKCDLLEMPATGSTHSYR